MTTMTPAAAPAVSASDDSPCVGYVTLPDGSTAPGCDWPPVRYVETECSAGERVNGPVCWGHFRAVAETVPTDANGHPVLLLSHRPLR
jgi:hypothetical protein